MTDAPPPPAGDEPFEPWLDVFPPDKPPNELLIGLCAGRDLAIRDTSVFTKGGNSDPRCVFSIKDRPDLKCQSTVKKKNLNPVYGETFSFELGADELEAPTLHVRCEDYDVGSAPDSMGIFDVKLRGKENKRKRKWSRAARNSNLRRDFDARAAAAPRDRGGMNVRGGRVSGPLGGKGLEAKTSRNQQDVVALEHGAEAPERRPGEQDVTRRRRRNGGGWK